MSARFVFPVMGTVVSLTTPDAIPVGVQQEVAGAFHRYDARFSLWRLGSEGDRVARRDERGHVGAEEVAHEAPKLGPQPFIRDDAGEVLGGTDHGIHRGARTG